MTEALTYILLAGSVILAGVRLNEGIRLRRLADRALQRIRHDHAYPMELGPHHCQGCDLEQDLRAALGKVERPSWARIAVRRVLRRLIGEFRIHIPPRPCPICDRRSWWSTRANRSKRWRVYCSPACKTLAARPIARHRTADAELVQRIVTARRDPRCPWPTKRRYDTEEAVREHLHTLFSTDGQLEAYPCPAGHWHAGHPTVDSGQRIGAIARFTTRGSGR